jgi:hypothetical protein
MIGKKYRGARNMAKTKEPLLVIMTDLKKADLGTWTPSGMKGDGAAPKGYKPGHEGSTNLKPAGEKAGKKMGMTLGEPPDKPKVKVSARVKAAGTKDMPESVMTSAQKVHPTTTGAHVKQLAKETGTSKFISKETAAALKSLDEAVKALNEVMSKSEILGNKASEHLVDHHYHKITGNAGQAVESKKKYDHHISQGATPNKEYFKNRYKDHAAGLKAAKNKSGDKFAAKDAQVHSHSMEALKNAYSEHFSKSLEEFGKPMARNEGESSNAFMSRIISHLITDKNYSKKKAVAAAANMAGQPDAKKSVAPTMRKALTGAVVPRLPRAVVKASEIDLYRRATTPVTRLNCSHDVDPWPLTPPSSPTSPKLAIIKSCRGCGRSYHSASCPTCDINKSYYCSCGRQLIKSNGSSAYCPKCNR